VRPFKASIIGFFSSLLDHLRITQPRVERKKPFVNEEFLLSTEKEITIRSAAGFFTPPKPKKLALLGLLLLVVTVGLYYPVKNHPFVNYDDNDYVTENLNVQSVLDWDTFRWAFTTCEFASWHSLTWLSHALDYHFFGLDPAGHHETNLLLHVLNVVLLFGVLPQVLGPPLAGP
jgi:hypothetical protein